MSNKAVSYLYIACAGFTIAAGFMFHVGIGLAAIGGCIFAVTRIAQKAERERHARDTR